VWTFQQDLYSFIPSFRVIKTKMVLIGMIPIAWGELVWESSVIGCSCVKGKTIFLVMKHIRMHGYNE
jgi:hypothetical protein